MAKLRLLNENMEQEERQEVINEWVEESEGLGRLVAGGMSDLLNESLNEERSNAVRETFQQVRDRKLERGEDLINESFDHAFGALVENQPEEFKTWWEEAKYGDATLVEAGPSGIRASHYRHLIDQCLTTIMVDLQCADAPKTTADMFSILPASPCPESSNQIQYCERVWPEGVDPCCESGWDEPAKFLTYEMDRRCWKQPTPCIRSVAFGLHDDLNCIDARQTVQAEMETMISRWRDETAEKERISALFGLPKCSTCSRHAVNTKWNYDGYEMEMYQSAGDCLWCNNFIGCEFNPNPYTPGTCPTKCESADIFRKRLREIWRLETNWNTGNPIECNDGQYQLFLTDETLAEYFKPIFGAFGQEADRSGPCNSVEIRQVAADPKFSDTYRTSRWAREVLVDFFLNNSVTGKDSNGDPVTINVAANRATAEYRADNTYLMSRDWRGSFGMYRMDEFQRTLTGTNHWHHFDRGYSYAKRMFWGYTFAPLRPWLTARFFAFDPAHTE